MSKHKRKTYNIKQLTLLECGVGSPGFWDKRFLSTSGLLWKDKELIWKHTTKSRAHPAIWYRALLHDIAWLPTSCSMGRSIPNLSSKATRQPGRPSRNVGPGVGGKGVVGREGGRGLALQSRPLLDSLLGDRHNLLKVHLTWTRGSTGVRKYGCIPRSAANNLGEIPKKLGAPSLLFWRVLGWRERFRTRPCQYPSHFGIRLHFLRPPFPSPNWHMPPAWAFWLQSLTANSPALILSRNSGVSLAKIGSMWLKLGENRLTSAKTYLSIG